MTSPDTGIDLGKLFERCEEILAREIHPIMAGAVMEFARHGAAVGRRFQDVDGEADELLTTRLAAQRLHVSEKQIYRLVADGSLRSHVFGRRHRFRTQDLDALVAAASAGARRVRAAQDEAGGRRPA